MKRQFFAICAAVFMLCAGVVNASAQEATPAVPAAPAPAATEMTAAPAAPAAPAKPTAKLDNDKLKDGGDITITGQAAPGSKVFVEVSSESKVRANRFDTAVEKETNKPAYKFYLTYDMPAYYKIHMPKEVKDKLEAGKKEGKKWSTGKILKETGADAAFITPAKAKIDKYQSTIMGSIMGSRGTLMPAMDEKATKGSAGSLVKARFRNPGKVFAANVDVKPDGSYSAKLALSKGQAPGKYTVNVVAVSGEGDAVKKVKADAVSFENAISFPTVYLKSAGSSINLLWPFILTVAVGTFGVLMGAGGGFILNPLLVTFFPLPHTIVAGTVMPTVLFSQGMGIANYNKIKFINWKLGIGIGCAMLVGGFIGPKLTEMITLDQFKFLFGWVLLVLAGLMYWQTTPGYLENNKKEQAILKEFKKRASEAAKGK
ncbi:MAG: permease [Desulfobulbaceae bacterium A2]|nr:MAG: permease [Desulfobulbaceae bacterium A2]